MSSIPDTPNTNDENNTPTASTEAPHDWLDVGAVIRGEGSSGRKAFYMFEEIPSEEPFRCQWLIERRAGALGIEGHLSGDLLLRCDTCEHPFLQPIAIGIDEMFVLSGFEDLAQGREKELLSNDFYEVVDSKGKIDLKDLAYQFLVMESTQHSECLQPPCPSAVSER